MGLLDRMAGAHPDQAKKWIEQAQQAWDAGKLAYVHKVGLMSSLDSQAATEAVDGILRIGWVLHSSALAYNQTGPNTEQSMFVFIRPPS